MSKQSWSARVLQGKRFKIVLVCVWAGILLFCLINARHFTVEEVLSYTPKNMVLAAAFMMVLFALKSLSIFIFSGILFAANGILFPLPLAIGLNFLGAGIMVSLPYWLGKRVGADLIDGIVAKYPKIEALRELQTDHEFVLSFVTRVVNVLPSDILSLYMGAVGIGYRKYLAGSILGMLLSIVTFPIMGMNLADPRSPAFLVSVCVQLAVSAAAIAGSWLYHRRKTRNAPERT